MLFYLVTNGLATTTQGGFAMHLYSLGRGSNIQTCLNSSPHRWCKLYKLLEKDYWRKNMKSQSQTERRDTLNLLIPIIRLLKAHYPPTISPLASPRLLPSSLFILLCYPPINLQKSCPERISPLPALLANIPLLEFLPSPSTPYPCHIYQPESLPLQARRKHQTSENGPSQRLPVRAGMRHSD